MGGRNGVSLSLPAPQSDVIDTTGAGDAFAAAFLAAELRGEKLEACLKAGDRGGSDCRDAGRRPARPRAVQAYSMKTFTASDLPLASTTESVT